MAAPSYTPPLSRILADLEGKAIVITGSTSGLGKAIALACVRANCRGVLICGRNAERGAAVVDAVRALNAKCLVAFCQGDLAAGEAVAAATMDAAIALFGTVDGLVNSAAVCFPRGTLETTSEQLWDTMLNTNLRAAFLLTQKAAAHMKSARARGSVVNVGSCCAHGGGPFVLAYSVSKGGMTVLTKNNAMELRGHGIRVNQVNMGWCLTDAEDAGQRAEKGANWLAAADAASPSGRLLRCDDTAASVVHFLSDATLMITGAVLDVSPDAIPGMMPTTTG